MPKRVKPSWGVANTRGRPARSLLLGCLLAGCGPPVDGGGRNDEGGSSNPTQPKDPSGTSSPSGDGNGSSTSVRPGAGSFLSGGTEEPPAVECSTFDQDCPGGEKCSPWANDGGNAWNATRCVAVDADPDGVGEPCTAEGGGVLGIDSCDGASMCFGADVEMGQGSCYAFCTGNENNPGCPAMSECLLGGNGVLNICIPGCDPLEPNGCAAGEVCVPNYGDTFSCALGLGDRAAGHLEPCKFRNSCAEGLFCAAGGIDASCDADGDCCAMYCDLAAPACEGEAACAPYYESGAPEGFEHIGYCTA